MKPLTDISVSSIQKYQKCPLRWCFSELEDRVPRYEPTAFTVGKMVHKAFEAYFEPVPQGHCGWISPGHYLEYLLENAKETLLTEYEEKAITEVSQLVEPLKHWADFYPIEETLEVETPHSYPLGLRGDWGLNFRIKPDRVVRIGAHIYHMQHKTLSAQRDVATFVEVASHSFHELLYAWVLEQKYCGQQRPEGTLSTHGYMVAGHPHWTYGGTIYNLVRKLKYKSAAKGKEGKILHEPHEFFSQWMVSLTPANIQQAVADLHVLARQMKQTADDYWAGDLPPCNRQQDEDMFSKRTDPYFDVIMGRTSLSDDAYFMDREDHYKETTV